MMKQVNAYSMELGWLLQWAFFTLINVNMNKQRKKGHRESICCLVISVKDFLLLFDKISVTHLVPFEITALHSTDYTFHGLSSSA